MKIISGGQTGVDRAALDVALKHGIECGGWCPVGRLAEDGEIPAHYPLAELPGGGSAERTAANVQEGDATVVIFFGKLAGGTMHTLQCLLEAHKAHAAIDAARIAPDEAADIIAKLVDEHDVRVLNVAGPRASEWAEGYHYATRALDNFLTRLEAPSPDRSGRQSKPE